MADKEEPTEDLNEDKPSERFLERLRRALRRDGDFPASAKTVNELRQLVLDPKTTGNQIAELILREPSLGTRILHLVNSSFYRRAKPIMTVSQAVVQIGMKPLAELCAGLVLLQRFVPTARRGGVFAGALRKMILSSLLARTITTETAEDGSQRAEETGYLAGCFSEMGAMLLAFYFPQIYEAAVKRSTTKNQPLAQSIQQLTGHTPLELSAEVVRALELPGFYQEVLDLSDRVTKGESPEKIGAPRQLVDTARSVVASGEIANVLATGASKLELDKVIQRLERSMKLKGEILSKVVGELPMLFKDHCASIDLDLPALPEYVATYHRATAEDSSDHNATTPLDRFSNFVDEVREAVEGGEPTAAVITTVMETCAWSLGFDRVLLLLVAPGRKRLVGRMLLGNMEGFDPTRFERELDNPPETYAPDVKAFHESRPIFNGDPLLENGWPFAALPVGFGSRAIGVIYADKADSEENELSERLHAALGVLAELLDRSVATNT